MLEFNYKGSSMKTIGEGGFMSGVNSVNAQMYVALEMLKKSGQIQEQAAEKLLEQADKQIKFNITEKLTESSENQVDIRA